jgi:hypothetical protein
MISAPNFCAWLKARAVSASLDPSAGAGLSAEGPRVAHRNRKPFGRGIHRGRQSRRPAADHGDIVHPAPGDGADHAHRARQFGFGRIAQHRAVGRHHQRQIGRRRRVPRDQFVGVTIGERIEQMMRIAVAGEKSQQANHVARIRGADQHRAADAALDQADPAQDQRAHDAFAEIGFGNQERAQPVGRDQQGLDIAFGHAIDQRGAAGELADLGEKLARPLIDDRRDVTEAVALADRDMAGQHDKHSGSGLAGLEQFVAVPVMNDVAEPAHARDFLRRQRRKCLLITRKRAQSRRAAVGRIDRYIVCAHFTHIVRQSSG